MTREQIIARLKELAADDSATAERHVEGDALLCQLLESLGYKDVVDAWTEIERWYE